MLSLLDMPEVVMNNILDFVGFQSLLTLRKVSHDFRNFIDDNNPDIQLDAIQVLVNSREMSVCWMKDFDMPRIHYSKTNNGCSVRNEENVKILGNVDPLTAFFVDFGTVLKHQKSPLKRFQLKIIGGTNEETTETILVNLMNILDAHPLKVKQIDIALPKQTRFCELLQCFEANTLEIIYLTDEKYTYENLNLQNIMLLDQWKKARHLAVWYFTIQDDFKCFFHFATVSMSIQCIYSKDLILIKEHGIHSISFEYFFITYRVYVNNFVECLGDPHSSELDQKVWFFKTERTEKSLKIVQFPSLKQINFFIVDSSTVPENVLENL